MLFLSTSYRRAKNITEVLEELGQTVVRHVELSGGTDDAAGIDLGLIELHRKYGFVYLVHNYFPPPPEHFILNIAAVDEAERRRSIEFAKCAIRLAAHLGLDLYTVHSGYRRRFLPGDDGGNFKPDGTALSDGEKALDSFERSVDELCCFALEHQIRLGIENMFPAADGSTTSLMCLPEELDRALERFAGYPNFGVLLDLAHINISAHLLGFDRDAFLDYLMTRHRPRVLAIHLSHNDGGQDSHQLLPSGSWEVDFLREWDVAGIPVTLEVRNQPLDDILNCYTSLKESLKC